MPPNAITNAEFEGEEEEFSNEEPTDEYEVIELQGMWDFILPNEADQEASPISTRSRNQLDPPQPSSKRRAQAWYQG